MNFCGLTDSPASIVNESERCRCGSVTRVGYGLCLSCLLQSGLSPEEPHTESFDAALAEIDVRDSEWRLGNYQILEEIGRGGMGVIYRARQRHSQRIVALKRILSYHSDSRDTLVRFQREAEAVASLDHPNILPIYEVGVSEDGLPFFSMKFAPGGSLLHGRKVFRGEPRQAVRLIAKVARAIDYANKQGILHRDLKPGNILLDGRGEPLVGDFGLAKWIEATSDLTRTMTVFGTPGYIAPEQVQGPAGNLTTAVDVYSLGAILFELLSGQPPFLGEHAIAVIRQATEKAAPKLRSVVSGVDRDLETICARCLQREPALRYQSAGALAEDLERWLQGRPIIARPLSPPVRLYRWSRRNRVLAGSLAVCFLFGAGVVTRQIQSWKLENKVRENEFAKNSIAVLPFLDLDHAIEDSDFTGAISRALQADLSEMGNARVISAAGTVVPSLRGVAGGDNVKAAARNFRTRTVLSGTLRKINSGVRISVRLLDPDGDLLLSRIVDLNEGSSFLKQLTHDLAPAIYSVLDTKDWSALIASERDPALRNERARELIAAGRELHFHYTVRDLDRAMGCFEKALKLEPRSALAHAYLASSAAGRTHWVADANLLAYAQREVEEAFRLAPDSGEVLRALVGVNYQRGQFGKALDAALAAMETSALDGKSVALLGMIYDELGRPDQALRWFEMARRSDRRPGEYDCHIGDCWSALGDDEKAHTAYRRAIDLHPERSEGWIGISHLYLLNGAFDKARAFSQENRSNDQDVTDDAQLAAQIEFFARHFSEAQLLYARLDQKNHDGGGTFYGAISYRSALGHLNFTRGASHNARVILQECLVRELKQLESAPGNPSILYRVSAIESSQGETESALGHLEAAVSAGWIDYRSLSLDPRFDAIANDLRFQTILRKLKLKMEDLRRAAEMDVYPKNPETQTGG